MDPSFIKEYEVSTFLVNSHKRLGLVGLLNMLQDCAGIHAAQLGLGHDQMNREQKFWVLTRQRVQMSAWPKWRDKVTLKTWPRALSGLVAVRDFEVFVAGKRLGICSTSWMVLDANTRRPTRPNIEGTLYALEHDLALEITPEKVQAPLRPRVIDSLKVRASDLDMNRHVNNTKYAEWILNAIDYEHHKNHVVSEYQVNFLSETHLGDEIQIECENLTFQGRRKSDDNIVFRARIDPMKIE